MSILGDVRFEAAFGVVQERYRRYERGEDGVERMKLYLRSQCKTCWVQIINNCTKT